MIDSLILDVIMDLSRASFPEEKPAASQQDVVIYEDPNFGYAERVLEKLGVYSNFPMYGDTMTRSWLDSTYDFSY